MSASVMKGIVWTFKELQVLQCRSWFQVSRIKCYQCFKTDKEAYCYKFENANMFDSLTLIWVGFLEARFDVGGRSKITPRPPYLV